MDRREAPQGAHRRELPPDAPQVVGALARPARGEHRLQQSARPRHGDAIPASLTRELAAHVGAQALGLDDYLFGDGDEPLNHAALYRRYFVRAAQAIGRDDVHFHDLRHTYASLMASHIDMLELSRRMGHQSYAMTADVYSHLYERDDPAKAVALDAAYSAAAKARVAVRY
jgi:integrase